MSEELQETGRVVGLERLLRDAWTVIRITHEDDCPAKPFPARGESSCGTDTLAKVIAAKLAESDEICGSCLRRFDDPDDTACDCGRFEREG